MEFVGYIVKIGDCYFRSKINGDYMICDLPGEAAKITTNGYAREIAEETGGVVKYLYVLDEKN